MIHDFAADYYYAEQRKSKKTIFLRILVLFLIIGLVYISINKIWTPKPEKKVVAGTTTQLISPTLTQMIQEDKGLSQVVQNALFGTKGSYGIVILNLKTNEYFLQNEHTSYKAASLYKLWTMATVLDQINNGKLNEKDVLSENIDVLYEKFHLASPSANKNITLSINDALEKMITISDNPAALLLSAKVKLSNITQLLNNNGLIGSKLGTGSEYPVTTPHDIAIFLKNLYDGTLVNKVNSEKMLAVLKRQRLNSKIPKYLPDELVIAHKTGELDESTHDAGIVYTPQGDYIIVVLSKSNAESRFLAEERIANLSLDVYNYFTKNTSNL